MKNKNVSCIYGLTALIFITYYIGLQLYRPFFISFSTIWLFLGILFSITCLKVTERGINDSYVFMKNKKWELKLAFTSVCCFILFICVSSLIFINIPVKNGKNRQSSYLILFCSGVNYDGLLTSIPKERLNEAALYLKKYPYTKVILSCQSGEMELKNEIAFFSEELESRGISKNRILKLYEYSKTDENLGNCLRLMSRMEGIEASKASALPVCILTSNFEISRLMKIAKMTGFKNLYGIKAKTSFMLLPDAYFKEICSLTELFFNKLIKGQPEKIYYESQ